MRSKPSTRRAFVLFAALAAGLPSLAAERAPAAAPPVARTEDWRTEFDAICAKTQDAMALSADELRRLVERSDALMPMVERLSEPQRTVFAKRLKACRDLYVFVLETREKEKS